MVNLVNVTNTMGSVIVPVDGVEWTVLLLVRLSQVAFISPALIRDLECDSLADGEKRRLREQGKDCECKEGWGGLNCNGAQIILYTVLEIN